MKNVRSAALLVITLAVFFASQTVARADTITTFGNINTNQFVATDNGNGTTTLTGSTSVNITQIFMGALDPSALFTFTATSTGDATQVFADLWAQPFVGTFTLTNQAGTFDYLDGTFNGALQLGALGGTNGLFTTNNTLGSLALTGDLAALINPEIFSLSLSNLTPPFSVNTYLVGGVPHTTIGSFTASFSGVADAAVQAEAVPEPASLMLLGTGLLGFAPKLRKRLNRNRNA